MIQANIQYIRIQTNSLLIFIQFLCFDYDLDYMSRVDLPYWCFDLPVVVIVTCSGVARGACEWEECEWSWR